ncbi:MAG TPA: hypothetical protein VIA81_11255 [Acidimicrobiia bacterium]|jgi:hypothetical protein
MDGGLEGQVRTLYRAALLIFVVTIVIGILNGLDVWEPEHNLLLTHVHAGTLGWITLAVVGAALAMFGDRADAEVVASARRVTWVTVVATLVYVAAFIAGTGIYRPIAGTLMLVAIVWALIWVGGRYRASRKTTFQTGIYLAMISLTIGAVLGVLLGLFIANGELPGMSTEMAGNLAGAHPPAMLIGYLVLAGVAITDWLLDGPAGRLGGLVIWGLFLAGIVANVAFVFNLEPLIQVFSVLEVVAIILYLIRMWPRVRPAAWSGGGGTNFARLSVVGLAVGIALLVYTVQLFVSGVIDPEAGVGPLGVLIAFDHSMFIGVMTNALFAAVAASALSAASGLVMWGTNLGLVGFLIGLVTDSAVLKRISTPIMGAALLIGIVMYLVRLGSARATPGPA